MQELMAIYTQYEEEYTAVKKKAPPLSGFLGFGSDPKKDPCHERFFQSVEKWIKDFLDGEPDSEGAYEAVHWIVSAAAEHKGKPVYWFMYAAHGLCRELVPLLSADQCAEMKDLYDTHFHRRDRMPAHMELYKLFCKGAQK